MAVSDIKLNAEELLIALPYFAACDARADGFRLAMEESKKMFLQHLLSQRKPKEEARGHSAA